MMGEYLQAVRDRAPLVHSITNVITVNDCANIILAAGGSPTMAQDQREAAEFTAHAAALVCNMGAVSAVNAMVAAGRESNRLGHPVILDPVAVGVSTLRRDEFARLLGEVRPAVITGNASEIRALACSEGAGSGVDAAEEDMVASTGVEAAVELAGSLARRTGAVVVATGPVDLVTDGRRSFLVKNGCPEMARITGSGCMLTALTGAFCGASPAHILEAALAATVMMGVCGQRAEARRLANGTGNATFRNDLIDAVELLSPEDLEREARYDEL